MILNISNFRIRSFQTEDHQQTRYFIQRKRWFFWTKFLPPGGFSDFDTPEEAARSILRYHPDILVISISFSSGPPLQSEQARFEHDALEDKKQWGGIFD
jgi:hypothetical protein